MQIKMPYEPMNKSLKYYLAGPMSGYPEYNYPLFTAVAQALRGEGLIVASPHENEWPEQEGIDDQVLWQYMMRSALRMLLDCRGIILLKGWPASRGAVIEVSIASALHMPMYFLDGKYLVEMRQQAIAREGQ